MSPALRALFAFVIPVFVGVIISQLINNYFVVGQSSGLGVWLVILASLGITAWILGMVWYGVAGMGVRGGRLPIFGHWICRFGLGCFFDYGFVFVEIEGFVWRIQPAPTSIYSYLKRWHCKFGHLVYFFAPYRIGAGMLTLRL